MTVRRENDATVIETTGVHVARRFGEALTSAFKGDLSVQYGEDDEHVRLTWRR
jgi:hypothetical protein